MMQRGPLHANSCLVISGPREAMRMLLCAERHGAELVAPPPGSSRSVWLLLLHAIDLANGCA
eukprot:4601980-Alexandrium_andersonii.AAC.1